MAISNYIYQVLSENFIKDMLILEILFQLLCRVLSYLDALCIYIVNQTVGQSYDFLEGGQAKSYDVAFKHCSLY